MLNRFAIVAVALLLASPYAGAAWSFKGRVEPDTARDVSDGWMYLDPDTNVAGSRVYFNGFIGTCIPDNVLCFPRSSVSANAAILVNGNPVLATSHQQWPNAAPMAVLGVWKDCNRDGYIGFGENGLFEYRTVLLPAGGPCIPSPNPTKKGDPVPHNDGQWVRELIPIGWDNEKSSGDVSPLDINDTRSRVWADWGRPDETELSCNVSPAPYRTYATTGGLIEFPDCILGYKIRAALSTLKMVHGDESLTFDDTEPGETSNSSSRLNRPNPFGQPTDKSYVSAFDCSQPPVAPGPGKGPWGDNILIHRPRVGAPSVHTDGSAYGTLNQTESELEYSDCDRQKNTDSRGGLVYRDVGRQSNGGVVKRDVDWVLQYGEVVRACCGAPPNPIFNLVPGGASAAPDYGNGHTSTFGYWAEPQNDRNNMVRDPFVDRNSLTPRPVTYMTFHAYVTPNPTKYSLPRGAAVGSYGDEACARPDTNWDCDRDNWWPGNEGFSYAANLGSDPKGVALDIRVGDPYNLRDVDCFDESVKPLRDVGKLVLNQPITPYTVLHAAGPGSHCV